MATISELVSFQIAQTETDLQSSDGLADYAAIKTSAIDRAKREFYGTGTIPSEGSISDIVKYYLSDVAVLYVIETAIDWYQSKTVQQQSSGDDSFRFYDRIGSLRSKRRDLQSRIAQAVESIKTIAFGSEDLGDIASLPLAQAQKENRAKVTLDPWKRARYLYGDVIQIAEGIEPRTVQADRP